MRPYPRRVIDPPAGYVVTVDPGDRIHFLDWGGPPSPSAPDVAATDVAATDVAATDVAATDVAAPTGRLLIHGLSQTAWIWAPVARRLARVVPTVAMDLRGHGLSDAPTEDGAYDLAVLADDVVAVAEGSGLLDGGRTSVALVGHGFGAMVAVVAAGILDDRCAEVILVDGGWEAMEAAVGMDADEFLRGLDEPPEVMRSLPAFLADRRGYDPSTWDADQDAAARTTVVETHAGRVVPATRPHALEACVRAMFTYEPVAALTAVSAPVHALIAADDDGSRAAALAVASEARTAAGRSPIPLVPFGPVGHNLMRYRPDEVTAAILAPAADARPSTAPAI
jgi:pimeloyl-ACP methyl ester carboxylesterase